MKTLRSTQATDILVQLQEAARGGVAVMIPGSWESRGLKPIVPAMETSTPMVSPRDSGSITDRERLERAREAGGAPSQRRTSRRTMFSRIWRYIMRPTGVRLV